MVVLGAQNVQSEDDLQGFNSPLPGRYHAILKDAQENVSKAGNPQCQVEFEVLAGTMPGQEGKTITAWLSYSEKAQDQLIRFAIVTGLLKPGDANREIDFTQAVGRQLVIEVEEREYEGKKKASVAYMGFWSVGNQEVAEVPKNEQALAYAAGQGNASGGNGSGAQPQQQATSPAPPVQTDAPAGGKWANI